MQRLKKNKTNKKRKTERIEQSMRDKWGTIKCSNIHVTGTPQQEKREDRQRSAEEIIFNNF